MSERRRSEGVRGNPRIACGKDYYRDFSVRSLVDRNQGHDARRVSNATTVPVRPQRDRQASARFAGTRRRPHGPTGSHAVMRGRARLRCRSETRMHDRSATLSRDGEGQTRGGWKIDVMSPTGARLGPSALRVKTDESSTTSTTGRLPQRSRPSGPGVMVETGRGKRLEQLSPEHGVGRSGPGHSGVSPPMCRADDDVPNKINSSS
jgi:hypothetical protein